MMTKWPDSNGAVFRRYVQGLGLRTAMAARVYHCILRGFQRFVSGYDPAYSVSQVSLTAWIQDRITVWPLHLVIHRARLVDRFLDWLVSSNHIAENPLAKLRAEYRQHSTAPIVRALADPNPVAALEKLRTLPPFGSHLGLAMRAHIDVMRTAGFRYGDYENRLLGLDRFLQRQSDAAEQPLAVLVQRWAQEASRLELHVARVQIGRIVGRALQREDPSVVMPRLDRQLVREVRRRQRRPHIFSTEEILKLFQTALAFPSPRASLRPRSLHTMLVLAYCAGLRLGEIARLRIGDVQIDQGVIRDSGNEILQDPVPPALTECTCRPSVLHGRAKESRWPFRQQLDSALASAGSVRILADYGGEFAGSCVASRRCKTASSQWPHRPTHSRPSPHIRGSPNDRMVSGRRQPRAHAAVPGHVSRP